jgi:hypothetical protein
MGKWQEQLAKRFNDPYFTDRFVEPLHLRVLALAARLFGGLKAKIVFDLIPKQSYAYSMMRAAELAKDENAHGVIAVEFGVASGRGLMNMADLAARIERETGLTYKVFGLDGGTGMPASRDYRDHPELYSAGDFPMENAEALQKALPENAQLLVGDLRENAGRVLSASSQGMPIGFVSFDLDYYYSTVDAMTLFEGDARSYLPATLLYFDDTQLWFHNRWQGELLAIEEFNATHPMRKIDKAHFIKNSRLLRNAHWLDQIYVLHVMDHPVRNRQRDRQRFVM